MCTSPKTVLHSLQTLMGKQFETAVVAVGQVPTAFMDALMRDGEDATSSQDKPDPSTIVVTGHPPMRVEVRPALPPNVQHGPSQAYKPAAIHTGTFAHARPTTRFSLLLSALTPLPPIYHRNWAFLSPCSTAFHYYSPSRLRPRSKYMALWSFANVMACSAQRMQRASSTW